MIEIIIGIICCCSSAGFAVGSFILSQYMKARHEFASDDRVDLLFKITLIMTSFALGFTGFGIGLLFNHEDIIFYLIHYIIGFINVGLAFKWMKKYILTFMVNLNFIQLMSFLAIPSLFSWIILVTSVGAFMATFFITWHHFGDHFEAKWCNNHVRTLKLEGIQEEYFTNVQSSNNIHTVNILSGRGQPVIQGINRFFHAYKKLMKAITRSNIPCSLIYEFNGDSQSIYFLVRGKTELESKKRVEKLKKILKLHLKEVVFNEVEENGNTLDFDSLHAMELEGIIAPIFFEDPLSKPLRDLIEQKREGIIAIHLEPRKNSYRVKSSLDDLIENALPQRYNSVIQEGGKIRNVPVYVKGKIREFHSDKVISEDIIRQVSDYSRYLDSYKHVMFGKTYFAFKNIENTIFLGNLFVDSLKGFTEPLKCKQVKDKYFLDKVKKQIPPVQLDYMIPPAGINLLWIPQEKIGYDNLGPWTPSTSNLSTLQGWNNQLESKLHLGRLINDTREVNIPMSTLRNHVLIVGNSGSGKSHVFKQIKIQLHDLDYNFLGFEAGKSEYRNLLYRLKNVRIFTPLDENGAPFRFNILKVPEGVPVITHILAIRELFNQVFKMYSPQPQLLKTALEECYKELGWDLTNNIPPEDSRRTPTLLEVADKCKDILSSKNLYEKGDRQTIDSALYFRLRELGSGVLKTLFNAPNGMSISELSTGKTFIELKGLSSPEIKTLFVDSLTFMTINYLEYKKENTPWNRFVLPQTSSNPQQKNKPFFFIIEEAHELFEGSPSVNDATEMQNAKGMANQLLYRLLTECRGHDVICIIIDQNPLKLPEIVLQECGTVISFNLDNKYQREAIMMAKNLSETIDLPKLGNLKRGQACVKIKGLSDPFYITTPPMRHYYYKDKDIGREELSNIMRSRYFWERPELLEPCEDEESKAVIQVPIACSCHGTEHQVKNENIVNNKIKNKLEDERFQQGFMEIFKNYLNFSGTMRDLIEFLILESFPLKENENDDIHELSYTLFQATLKSFNWQFQSKNHELKHLQACKDELESYKQLKLQGDSNEW